MCVWYLQLNPGPCACCAGTLVISPGLPQVIFTPSFSASLKSCLIVIPTWPHLFNFFSEKSFLHFNLKHTSIKNIPLVTSSYPTNDILFSSYPPNPLNSLSISACYLQLLIVPSPPSSESSSFCLLSAPKTPPTKGSLQSSTSWVSSLSPTQLTTSLGNSFGLCHRTFLAPLLSLSPFMPLHRFPFQFFHKACCPQDPVFTFYLYLPSLVDFIHSHLSVNAPQFFIFSAHHLLSFRSFHFVKSKLDHPYFRCLTYF